MQAMALYIQNRKPLAEFIDYEDKFGDKTAKEVCRCCGRYLMPHRGMVQHVKDMHQMTTKAMRKLPVPFAKITAA